MYSFVFLLFSSTVPCCPKTNQRKSNEALKTKETLRRFPPLQNNPSLPLPPSSSSSSSSFLFFFLSLFSLLLLPSAQRDQLYGAQMNIDQTQFNMEMMKDTTLQVEAMRASQQSMEVFNSFFFFFFLSFFFLSFFLFSFFFFFFFWRDYLQKKFFISLTQPKTATTQSLQH